MATAPATFHYPETGSTQDDARRLVGEGHPVPLLVVADRQTLGRGRGGRAWKTAPRALACSLAVRPDWPSASWGPIPLLAGLAAARALAGRTGVTAQLKWPNDLVLSGKKLGGILVEASGGLAVVGIGINLWWPDPPDGITAACAEDPGAALAGEVAAAAARDLLGRLGRGPGSFDSTEYAAQCTTLGTEVTWKPSGRGIAVGITDDGGLIVEAGGRRRTIRSGEVRSVRTASLRAADEPEAETYRE
jgi:BirA family biotin operon repressor/biotin-[acetyl-CoA-carboxylase] ligase